MSPSNGSKTRFVAGRFMEKMGKRRQARALAVQVLFHMEFNPGDPDEGFRLVSENYYPSETDLSFSRLLVTGIWEKRADLDALIRRSSTNWRLERMSHVDRNILRMGVYEMLFMNDIPPKVSIDEAVELGKKFGTEESGSFINGVLDHIYNQLQQEGAVSGKTETS
jgi:transcription antitermination factor NusB